MASNSGIIGTSAPQGEGAEPDGLLCGPGVGLPPARRRVPGVRLGRPRTPPTQGDFPCWLLGHAGIRVGVDPTAAASVPSVEFVLVGGCSASWAFVAEGADAAAAHASALESCGDSASPGWGYIQYKVKDVWNFDAPVALPGEKRVHARTATASARYFAMTRDMRTSPGGLSVRERVHAYGGQLNAAVCAACVCGPCCLIRPSFCQVVQAHG